MGEGNFIWERKKERKKTTKKRWFPSSFPLDRHLYILGSSCQFDIYTKPKTKTDDVRIQTEPALKDGTPVSDGLNVR